MSERTDREVDALVAEKVMGWKLSNESRSGIRYYEDEHGDEIRLDSSPMLGPGWSFTNDVQADYSVLQYVRDTWTPKQLKQMRKHLYDLWADRDHSLVCLDGPLGYEPGDYSRAALAVVEETKDGQ